MNYTENLKQHQKVISLSAWKMNKEQIKETEEFRNYLQCLKTNSLLIEVNNFILELKNTINPHIDSIQIGKGKLILDEISNRLSTTSPELSAAVSKIKEGLAEKISRLDNIQMLNNQGH